MANKLSIKLSFHMAMLLVTIDGGGVRSMTNKVERILRFRPQTEELRRSGFSLTAAEALNYTLQIVNQVYLDAFPLALVARDSEARLCLYLTLTIVQT